MNEGGGEFDYQNYFYLIIYKDGEYLHMFYFLLLSATILYGFPAGTGFISSSPRPAGSGAHSAIYLFSENPEHFPRRYNGQRKKLTTIFRLLSLFLKMEGAYEITFLSAPPPRSRRRAARGDSRC
jgi:hypothetical protein